MLYETFWHALEPALAGSEGAEDLIELCSGTGGQFDFYPGSVDIKSRFVGIDTHPESNALLLQNHGVPAHCGDIFYANTYERFNSIYGRRNFAGCVGTNAIYFARDQRELRKLFVGLDSILSKGEPGMRFIAQLICGRPPSLNDWGGDPYKFKEQFFRACETELNSLGYVGGVRPIIIRLDFDMSDKDAKQSDYLEYGRSIGGKTFNGILWDGVGCDFTRDGTLTNFLDYEYQVQQVNPLNRFHEAVSAYLLVATKVLS